MIRNTMFDVVYDIWPMLLVSIVVIIMLRIVYLMQNKESLVLYRELMMLTFIIYIMCMFYIVTIYDVSYSNDSNFIPFKEIMRYTFGSNLFLRNVIGNIVIFMPFGFFVGYILKLNKLKIAFFITLVTSFIIEFVQLHSNRIFDIDDIILNVSGAVVGCAVYILLYRFREKLPSIFKSILIYNFLVITMLIALVAYLFRLKWGI